MRDATMAADLLHLHASQQVMGTPHQHCQKQGQSGTWGVWPMTRRLQLVRSSTCRSWLLAWYLSYRVPKHSWLKVRFHITLRLSL